MSRLHQTSRNCRSQTPPFSSSTLDRKPQGGPLSFLLHPLRSQPQPPIFPCKKKLVPNACVKSSFVPFDTHTLTTLNSYLLLSSFTSNFTKEEQQLFSQKLSLKHTCSSRISNTSKPRSSRERVLASSPSITNTCKHLKHFFSLLLLPIFCRKCLHGDTCS